MICIEPELFWLVIAIAVFTFFSYNSKRSREIRKEQIRRELELEAYIIRNRNKPQDEWE